MDDGETGVDCGGPCPKACVATCPCDGIPEWDQYALSPPNFGAAEVDEYGQFSSQYEDSGQCGPDWDVPCEYVADWLEFGTSSGGYTRAVLGAYSEAYEFPGIACEGTHWLNDNVILSSFQVAGTLAEGQVCAAELAASAAAWSCEFTPYCMPYP
jgi:hypothetical protein